MGLEAWLIGGAIASVAGAGVSAYSSYQQGKTADALAQYNAHQQEMNAKMQLMSVQAQAALQKRMADAQLSLRQQEAQAMFNNAKTIENTMTGKRAATRESIRRQSLEHDRIMATTRANIAKSGVVESSGTPLELAAYQAEMMTLENLDTAYEGELEQRNLFREAELERLGGKLALAGATLDRSSSLAQAGLTGAGGQLQYRKQMREAEFTRLSGAAQRQTSIGNAWGTLFTGIGSAAGMYGQYKAL